MRKIQLVYSNPVPGMEDEFRVTRHPVGGATDSGSAPFCEAIGEKVVKR